MSATLDRIFDTARARRAHIVLPEGGDPRVTEAAAIAVREGLAQVTLLDGAAPGCAGIDSATAADLPALVEAWLQMRRAKGMTEERAEVEMRDPIRQAAMRVRLGLADGTVGGSVATTADTVRAALQAIGRAPGAGIVSSFFLMIPPEARPSPIEGGVIFADCGLVIAPSAAELADIALSAAASCRALLSANPRVAMLSFSTAGSAEHESITRVREAVATVRERAPDLQIDGELQFDAAIDAAIRQRKAPGSPLTGQPNVFIFPDLGAGNIGYKMAQRLGGFTAIGPVLQGLARPANDLSRGASVDDIVAAIAVTGAQAAALG
ncbi:phosphate acetyltransferase [Paracoccus suum]|uniref:Phosphate acetyltransferase n=1 Tax=Paracoccus suum TaxID=2259340 RepID=A0A344PIN4_9RHOB|nr:phosphate acetyltransferase [Paracoccus suum]AXC49239.1 phosphate acetyltransferase [Paracoccus suum]